MRSQIEGSTESNSARAPLAHGAFRRRAAAALAAITMIWTVQACTPGMADDLFGDDRFILGLTTLRAFYTEPGVDRFTQVDKKLDLKMIKLIEDAKKTVDVAVYNLSRTSVIEALTLAEERGIRVRMVGDVDEVVTNGYRAILRTRIPFSLGNTSAIQHNKFAVVDGRFLFMGTGNITNSGFLNNNENFMIMESESMATAFTKEFEQMYYGRYGSKKVPLTSNFNHRIDFTNMELYFSPYNGKDAMNRIIDLVNNAQRNVKYMIFAHTHDELSTAKIRAAKRGVLVRGIHDSTFVNGTSEEAPRFYGASQYLPTLQVRRDGNENTATVGLASHGGKLHCKTIIIDDSVFCTGSFNWSNNAVENNDENLVCVHNPMLAEVLGRQWQGIWDVSQPVTNLLKHPSGDVANPGDVVISEVNWAGGSPTPNDFIDKTDDWIELYNTTNKPIDVSHWSISWDANETVFYPIPDQYNWYKPGVSSRHYFTGKLIIPAKGHFLLKAQNNAIDQSDNKISGVKNFRLNDSGFHIRLYDVTMTKIDEAGNGEQPVAGTFDETFGSRRTFSMERFFYPAGHPKAGLALPGASPGSWYTSNGNNFAGVNVRGIYQVLESFTEGTIGTPRYSGNGSVADPTTVQSQAFGAFHGRTNDPVRAFSTSSTSARIQMRWSMASVAGPDDFPAVTIFPDICGGPCARQLDPNDQSVLIVTTGAQTSGTNYTFSLSGGNDVTGGFIPNRIISFNGYGLAQATFRITRVGPRESNDLVELTALTSGRANGLGIYHYKSEFDPTPPVLLYRLYDIEVTAGQTVRLLLNAASSISDDNRCPNGCLPGSVPVGATVPANSGVTTHIEHNGGDLDTVWNVFSRELFIDTSDGILFLAYTLTETPMDMMCYSNRDGSVQEGLMQGGLRYLYGQPASVYKLGVFPVAGNNDFNVQSACADYSRGTAAGDILIRVGNNRDANDFQCQNGGNPC